MRETPTERRNVMLHALQARTGASQQPRTPTQPGVSGGDDQIPEYHLYTNCVKEGHSYLNELNEVTD